MGLRGACCSGVAHSRLRRVAARAGLGRRGVCAACLAGVVRGAVAGRALRGGRVQPVSQRTRLGVGVGGRVGPCSGTAGRVLGLGVVSACLVYRQGGGIFADGKASIQLLNVSFSGNKPVRRSMHVLAAERWFVR